MFIFFAGEGGEALYSQQKQDLELTVAHELLIAKFRLKLKKVWESTRAFRYELNQIYLLLPLKTLQLFENTYHYPFSLLSLG